MCERDVMGERRGCECGRTRALVWRGSFCARVCMCVSMFVTRQQCGDQEEREGQERDEESQPLEGTAGMGGAGETDSAGLWLYQGFVV